jgi:hypothetical protein
MTNVTWTVKVIGELKKEFPTKRKAIDYVLQRTARVRGPVPILRTAHTYTINVAGKESA